MEQIKIFQNEQFGKVRIAIDKSGEPMFAGADIATMLGYENPRKAIRDHVDEEDKDYCQLSDFQEGNETLPPHMKSSKLLVINESGVFSLIMRSKLPQAKDFKRWVTSEVLPSIRKTGGYVNDTRMFVESYFSNLDDSTKAFLTITLDDKKKLLEENKKQKDLLEYQEPLAVLGDAVMEYDDDITIRELSKILCQNGVDTGEVRLRDQFKVEKYLNQDGLPSQRSIENGWLAIAKRSYEHPKYGMQISRKAMVTPKGQKYFVNKFLKSKQHAN
nr:MAG TPA: repressor domain protein [Caudoviricetes sp.]